MKKAGGLEALLAARRLGVRQTDGMEERIASGPMFTEQTDEEYRKTVESRRAQGRFVVGKGACVAAAGVACACALAPCGLSLTSPPPFPPHPPNPL